MVASVHEVSKFGFNPLFGQPGATLGFGRVRAKSLDWHKDRGLIAGLEGSASGMDLRRVGLDADEPEPLDSRSKRRRCGSSEAQAEAGAAFAVGRQAPEGAAGGLGEVASGFRAESSAVGWPHVGDSLKAPLRDNTEGKAGSEVDTSVGLPLKTGQPRLSASTSPRCSQVPAGLKKNFRARAPLRPRSFRTRVASRRTLVWGGAGPKGASVCEFPLPLSTLSV